MQPHEDYERVGDARYYHRLTQGCDEWLRLRLGLLTASEFDKVLTPTLLLANNAGSRAHVYDLATQRITGHLEPHFTGWDMERGKLEEVDARIKYAAEIAPVTECGFIVNDGLGFDIGYSPDGLVGDYGLIEIKSRLAKFQVRTIIDHLGPSCLDQETPIPREFMLQIQAGLFITGRNWCDFVSYSNGLNMAVIRVYPISEYQDAIWCAAKNVEDSILTKIAAYNAALKSHDRNIFPVARTDYSEEIMA